MSDALEAAREVLRATFGFPDFRPGQGEIVEAVLAGEDVLAVMPTGSGKSLCYQLPSLVRGGLTVVVSPLIALMRDQVGQLREWGVEAASLNSTNDAAENDRVQRALADRRLRLLYVAPERLMRPDTLERLGRGGGVGLLAIDEAHCVSQWGHDFRPEYLALGEARRALGRPQTIALTATADAPTRADIAGKLFETAPRSFVRSFDRPNLRLAMRPKADGKRQLRAFVAERAGASGIVYCASRKRTEQLAVDLSAAGHRALPYHAGQESGTRARHQDRFLQEDGVVMIATVAFGMGIDKPDVRFVAHADLPSSIEAYWQEIGRAGRDGLPADTLTLYGFDDMRLRRLQIEQGDAPEERKRIERARFAALLSLCEAPRCRRQTLLAYFGEPVPPPCGFCDLCLEGVERYDATIDAQKAMSAILRTGERFGTEHLVRLLRGEANDAIGRHRHDTLPTFGVGRDRDADAWRSVFRQLYALGLITLDIGEFGSWGLTDEGRRVLRGRESVELRRDTLKRADRRAQVRAGAPGAPPATAASLPAADASLLAALKALRLELARDRGVPAYAVFADRTLIEMAQLRPSTLAQMREIHGVGDAKLATYGTRFLAVVTTHTPAAGR